VFESRRLKTLYSVALIRADIVADTTAEKSYDHLADARWRGVRSTKEV
jgi:hypothetical protein